MATSKGKPKLETSQNSINRDHKRENGRNNNTTTTIHQHNSHNIHNHKTTTKPLQEYLFEKKTHRTFQSESSIYRQLHHCSKATSILY